MPSTDPFKKLRIWNQFDEFGLVSGLDRIPKESNSDFRNRIIGHEPYNSTEQGLVNWLSDSLLTATHNTQAKVIFSSLREPLSSAEYQRLEDKTEAYFAPRVIIGSTTWIIPATDNDQKDEVENIGITWTLWKQLDGFYDRIWTTDIAPTTDIELQYQWKSADGTLYIVRELASILTWENAEIVEINPDE